MPTKYSDDECADPGHQQEDGPRSTQSWHEAGRVVVGQWLGYFQHWSRAEHPAWPNLSRSASHLAAILLRHEHQRTGAPNLAQTLDDLHGWKVSVLAQTGLSFDLSTASGKLMRTIMAGLAEFERDLIRGRVKSGLAAARARGIKLGRQVGQRPSDKKAKKVLAMHQEGCPTA
jgi:hypothetical protein